MLDVVLSYFLSHQSQSPIGSLPKCTVIGVRGNPGNAAPLEASCEERGITLS